jgi:hypothetical protein
LGFENYIVGPNWKFCGTIKTHRPIPTMPGQRMCVKKINNILGYFRMTEMGKIEVQDHPGQKITKTPSQSIIWV